MLEMARRDSEDEEDDNEESVLLDDMTSSIGDSYTLLMPPCTIIVEPLMFLSYFAMQGSLPVVEQYLYSRYSEAYPILRNSTVNHTISETCQTINSTDSAVYNATQEAQADTSHMMMYLSVINIIPSLVTTLLIGGYSDKKLRKPALVLPSIGLVLRLTAVLLVVYFRLDTYVLLIAYALDGLSGGFATLGTGCWAYLADIIKPDSRAFRIVLLDIVLALSSAAALFCAGLLIKEFGFMVSSAVILGSGILSLIYVLFILPETHKPLPGTTASFKEIVTASYAVYAHRGERRHKLFILIAILFFAQLPVVASGAVGNLFLLNYPLCWGPATIGVFAGVSLAVIEMGSLFGSYAFLKCMSEIHVLLIGCLSGTAAYCYYGFCTTTTMVFGLPALALFEFLPIPMARGLGSRLVLQSEQGALFAGMSVIYNLSAILGSVAFNAIYTSTLHVFIGATFEVCAGCYLISFILGSVFLVSNNRKIGYKRVPTTTNEPPDEDQKYD